MESISYIFFLLRQLIMASIWTRLSAAAVLGVFLFFQRLRLKQLWSKLLSIRQTFINPQKVINDLNEEVKKIPQSFPLFLRNLLLFIPAISLLTIGNILFQVIYAIPFVNMQRKRFEKEAKPIFYFKSIRTFFIMGGIGTIFAMLLTNYVVTILRGCIGYLYYLISTVFVEGVMIPFNFDIFLARNLLKWEVFLVSPILAIPVFITFTVLVWKSSWINFEQYRDYNANESGDDRFEELKGLERQYKKVPNRGEKYEGHAGVPIVHIRSKNVQGLTMSSKMKWRNKQFGIFLSYAEQVLGLPDKPSGFYLIDDDTVNALITGMTRSGKGETFVAPMIEMNSRASIPSSQVITDPKGELYQAFYKLLRRRGFDVDVLNFQNMDFSMSYNLLGLAINAAKKGYYEKTQTRVNAVAESIYRRAKSQGDGNAKYWEDTSISLFNAITMALIDRARETYQNGEKDAWDTITIRNITKFLTDLGSEDVQVDAAGTIVEQAKKDQQVFTKSKLTVYFDNLRKINEKKFSKFREMADTNFRSSDFASAETKGNVYSSMLSGISLFLQDDIAKLTSRNSIDIESVGNPRRFSVKLRSTSNQGLKNLYAHQTAKVNIYGMEGKGINTHEVHYVKNATALIDGEGYLNYVIDPKLPKHFRVVIDFDHENNSYPEIQKDVIELQCSKRFKVIGLRKVKDRFSKKPIVDGIQAKIYKKPKHTLLEEKDIEFVYSDKPKIIFIVTPPNRSEYSPLVSLFINQLFDANYEMALNNAFRRTINRIQFILDEFGNLPAIPNMGEKLSIGLGQNIQFMLFVQNLEQITEKYGENTAETIIGNCSLNTLIKTTSGKTAKAYSGLLGTKTITKRTKSGNVLDESNPNIRFDNPEQPLMTDTQLLKLQAGEAVTVRGVKAQDLSGRKVTTDPIFVSGKMELPYRYMFLQKEFDQKMTISDIPVESSHRGLDLQELAVDAKNALDKLLQWKKELVGEAFMENNGKEPLLASRNAKTVQTVQSEEEQRNQIMTEITSEFYG